MAQVIANGAIIEALFVSLITSILQSEAATVAAMLGNTINFRLRIDMARSAVETKFDDEDVSISKALFSFVAATAEQRNKFAHNIFGICAELPNDLLLVPVDAYIAEFIKTPTYVSNYPLSSPDKDLIEVYRENDIREILRRQMICQNYICSLDLYLTERQFSPTIRQERRAELLASLCNEPSIRAAWYRDQKASREDGWPILGPRPSKKPR